jgi:hypothetical protein
MKSILRTFTLALSVVLFGSLKNTVSAQGGVDVGISYQSFYDELSPHGRWIDYPEYGYVWAPNLGPEFQPYNTGGQWVWSDEYDWIWVSDYSWGWAPFHYGRWFRDDYYGWMWVPGYDWSPGWVSWRTGGDYYGWAPLRPGISISIGFGNYNPPYDYWCFTPRRYINHRNIGRYCVDRGRNVTIINNTTIINNYGNRNNVFVNGGPGRRDAERYTGRIRSVNFRETDRPGGREFRNNRLSVYRPQIQRNNDRQFTPRNFDRYNRDGQNNGNSIRGNRNNQADRGEANNNRGIDRRNNNSGQPGNRDIADRRRNVLDRENNRVNNAETNRSSEQSPQAGERRNVFERNRNNNRGREQREVTTDRPIERRNVFDRNRNNDRPNTQQPADDRRRERPAITNRNIERPADNGQRQDRTVERRNRELQQNDQRNERRQIFERNNAAQQPERRDIRNENRQQRQSQPQIDRQPQRENRQFESRQQRQPQQQIERQPQREPRQIENRGNEQGSREQRSDNNGRGRPGRRD